MRTLDYHDREIVPEYEVKNNEKVDYTLQVSGKNKVFIEAKSPKEDLENEKHQKQLFNYSAQKNPDLAILTNGSLWWFYLPRAEGDWDDRKFYTINILEQEIEDIVDKFDLLLSRQNVASGEAVRQAESILENRQREKIVKERLPEAWNKVIRNAVSPDSLLVDILAETAEEVCGFKLESDEILGFIRSNYEKWLLSPEQEREVPPPTTGSQNKNQIGKPKRMQIGSKRYEWGPKKEIFINTANWLIDKGDLKSSDCPVDIGIQKKIIVIDKNPNTLKEPRELKNGLYIDYQYSRRAPDYAKRLLEKYRYDPEMLQIEH